MQEGMSLPFVFPKTVLPFTFQNTYAECLFWGLSVSIKICIFSQYYIHTYVVFGNVLLTSICLRKPHLEQKKKHSCLPHMQEIMSLPFRFPKTCTSISRSCIHIRSVFSDDCLWEYWKVSIPSIHGIGSLGSTDDVLLTSICLRKPHLEHKKKRSCLPHMQEIYIYIYVVLGLGSTDQVF